MLTNLFLYVANKYNYRPLLQQQLQQLQQLLEVVVEEMLI